METYWGPTLDKSNCRFSFVSEHWYHLVQYLVPMWEPWIMHCLFVWLICSKSGKRGCNDPINEYLKNYNNKLYERSDDTSETDSGDSQTHPCWPTDLQALVGPSKRKRKKIKVSVLPMVLLLKLRSSSHCQLRKTMPAVINIIHTNKY